MIQKQEWFVGESATSSKVILLVEDDADNAQVIADLITQETPHKVISADVPGALKFVHIIKPDLLILDYLFPETNGIILYDHLHANRELASIPTLIISAALYRCKEDIEKRHLVGLSKPFNVADLLSLVNALLSEDEQAHHLPLSR